MKLRLATRGSTLAWGQSSQVADLLRRRGHEVELVRVTTHGDVTTAPLASLGGAGVFVGAVRAAVISGDCDFAVHSFKDLPTAPAAALTLAAVPTREDPADALCTADGRVVAALPPGARVGTGSPRRAAQLLALRPDLVTVEIRGNVETRLARAGDDLDAVILAAAGLTRIGLADRISERFDPAVFLPAPAQGALALECRADAAQVCAALSELDDPDTRWAAVAERAVLAGLKAGCAAPVGAHAQVRAGRLELAATVISVDGATRLSQTASTEDLSESGATTLGASVTATLRAQGAASIVDLGATKPRPLAGRRFLLPQRCPDGLAEALASAGATLVRAELTRQEPLDLSDFRQAVSEDVAWLVVNSSATVHAFAAGGYSLADELPHGTSIAAVGPATAAALRSAGVEPDLIAHPGGGAALVAAFPAGSGRIVVPGAQRPSSEPIRGLQALGWSVVPVPVYRTAPVAVPQDVRNAWSTLDAAVATAGSVAEALAELGLPGAPVIAIGAATATAARAAGLSVIGVAATPDTGGIVDAVLAAFG